MRNARYPANELALATIVGVLFFLVGISTTLLLSGALLAAKYKATWALGAALVIAIAVTVLAVGVACKKNWARVSLSICLHLALLFFLIQAVRNIFRLTLPFKIFMISIMVFGASFVLCGVALLHNAMLVKEFCSAPAKQEDQIEKAP